MHSAALSGQEKSLALASSQKSLASSEVAMAMRILFGPCGGAARQDVMAVAYVDESSGSDKGQEACAAYKKAKQQGAGRRKGDGMPKKSSDTVNGGRPNVEWV